MLKIYGSPLCPHCRECKAAFDACGLEYEFIDINESLKNLKEFLSLRDHLAVFDPCIEKGSIGIPALRKDDGTVTLDWRGYQAEQEQDQGTIIKEERVGAVCSLDQKNC